MAISHDVSGTTRTPSPFTGENVPRSTGCMNGVVPGIIAYIAGGITRVRYPNPPNVVVTRCEFRFTCRGSFTIESTSGLPWILSRSLYSKYRAQ